LRDERLARRLTDEQIEEIRRLRGEGLSVGEIAKVLRRNKSNVIRAIKKYLTDSEKPRDLPGATDVDTVQNEGEGVLSVTRHEGAASVEDLRKMAGLSEHEWIAGRPEVGEYHMAYKLRNFVPRKTMRRLVEIVKAGGGEKECFEELEVAQTGHNRVKLYTTRVRFNPVMPNQAQVALKEWVSRNASKPLPKQRWKAPDKKAEIALNWGYYDVHIGMYAWAKEVGADYDVGIALTRVLNSVDQMVDGRLRMLPSIDVAYVPIGNDLGHFDGVRQTTSMGDHHLDVDTRFPKVFDAAVTAQAYQIERLCEVCNRVILVWVPGNHDTSMSYGIFRALTQRFLKWPQIEVCDDAGERKYQYFHHNIIGFDHGKLKPEAYQSIVMNECRGHLDNCHYCEINRGHTHEPRQLLIKTSVPTNGIQVRTHPSLAEADSWHHGKGFLGAPMKSVEALYYSPSGRIGDFVVYADDERRRRDVDEIINQTLSKK